VPVIEGDGTILSVTEAWKTGKDRVAMCIQPQVEIKGLEGTLEVQWFLEGENIAFDTIEVSPG
jgi:hypothetical protein